MIAIVQEINKQDKINGLEMLFIHNNYQGIKNNIFLGVEAHFYLNDDVKKLPDDNSYCYALCSNTVDILSVAR